ncbi:MAG: hypothetical protein AAGC46_04695 [Solirubrobacteraceae bacterium]|nr:hypothetical protein [Patulibacter sp.]
MLDSPTKRLHPSLSARRTQAVALVAASALVGGVAIAPGPAAALPPGGAHSQSNGATVTLKATKVKAGGRVKVSGANWKSKGSRVQDGAQVTVKLDDATIVAVFPIKNKRFSGSVIIPKQVAKGKHWLRFLAAEPATSIKSHTFTVTK